LPVPIGFSGFFQDRKATLSWDYSTLQHLYNYYFIERSEKGDDFRPLSDTPIGQMHQEGGSKTMLYIDSIPQNNKEYAYRLRGKTIFGTFSPYSKVIKGKGITGVSETAQLTKSILLLLWNSISLVGSFFLVFSSYKVLAIYGKISDVSQLTAASPEVEQIVSYAPMMFLGTLIVLAGTAVFLMANYAYSQTDFILYDQLSTGTYQGPWQVLVQSRRMMKGYKWKRFLLDLSFIGWYILIGITLGIAGVVAYPYITTARVLFYENLKSLSK